MERIKQLEMKDKDTVSPKPDLPVEVEEYFAHCYGPLASNLKDHIFDGRDMLDFAYGFARRQQSRIAELEKENAELDTSEAGWFNSCTEYQKENDALIIENCALESRLQKANQYLEGQGMEVRF